MSWRYENCGEADSVIGGSTYNVVGDDAKSLFGVAFAQWDRSRAFDIPKDATEIWIHCWVYHKPESTSRFRIYNDPNHGEGNGCVTGICLEENTSKYLQVFCNGVSMGHLDKEFSYCSHER